MKLLVGLSLALYSLTGFANWQLIDKNSEYELYLKSSTLVKTQNGFRFTWLYSYYKQNRGGTKRTGYYNYQSFGYDEEINCRTKEARIFSSSPYTGRYGTGLIYTKNMSAQWMPVYHKNKGVGSQTIFEKLCR